MPIEATENLLAATPGLMGRIEGQHIFSLYGMPIDSPPTLSAKELTDWFLFGDVTVTAVGYLATYVYQPSGGASGEFTISVVEKPSATFLNNAAGLSLDLNFAAGAVVDYGIDCYNDTHCDDDNPCTTDTCTSNECGYANVAASTACDDGLWCTAGGSTCDGNGNCTGGNPRCDPGEICDEQGHFCIGEP